MIGIDTNLLVRLVINDNEKQAKFTANLFEKNAIFIPKTVLLETEWVLRFTYELNSQIILEIFENVLGLPQVTIEDLPCILQTLKWYKEGFDFADALHLASCNKIKTFATLDKALIKKAKQFNIDLITLAQT